MLLEILATLVISTQNIKERVDVNNYNPSTSHSIVGGDSQYQVREKERIAREQSERIRQQVIAREEAKRASRGGSYQASGYDIQVIGTSFAQCVIFYKEQTGKSESLGYAGNIKPKTQEAKVGYGALEKGHISLVIAVYDDAIRVREANYYRGKVTERTILKSQIRGYYF